MFIGPPLTSGPLTLGGPPPLPDGTPQRLRRGGSLLKAISQKGLSASEMTCFISIMESQEAWG